VFHSFHTEALCPLYALVCILLSYLVTRRYVGQRTLDGKGVTVPSQQKYVEYMDLYLRYQRLGYTPPIGSESHRITIHRIVVYGLARVFSPSDLSLLLNLMCSQELCCNAVCGPVVTPHSS
jgi:hypothetical protein